ncbi:hypothetical protein ABID62_006176 [Bradyrhizobium sp. S3.9.1]
MAYLDTYYLGYVYNYTGSHSPRRRGIQYAAAPPHHGTAAAYWITRFRG